MPNYFETLGLPHRFDVDSAALEKNYFERQKLFHPDRLVGRSMDERQAAISRSMQVNEALEALGNPLSRARHMLALKGITVGGENDTVKPDAALLMQVMEWREGISDVNSAAALESWRTKIAEEKVQTIAQLGEAFAAQRLPEAAQLTMRLSYVTKIEQEIRKK